MKAISALLLMLVVMGYVSALPSHLDEEQQESFKVPFYAEFSSTRVPGEYVVIFQDYVQDIHVAEHMKALEYQMTLSNSPEDNEVLDQYHIGTFRGYGAKMSNEVREAVRSMDNVKYVEASQYYYADQCTTQHNAVWGLVRTTTRDLTASTDYTYFSNSGGGVDIYIIDTGIDIDHPDFGGRATFGASFVGGTPTDENGHGTHVAGTAMSNTYGIAKKATAISVRVLNAGGGGTTNGVISGINYAANQAQGKKSVANASLGGGRSTAINAATDAAVNTGLHFAVAAGNSAADACNFSPASATLCETVAASDSSDNFAWFSNYGSCVDIIAPGVDIKSLWLHDGYNTISGTSMASPHVAGVMAKILGDSTSNPPPSVLRNFIHYIATVSKIMGVPSGTPNLLLYRSCP